MSTPNWLAVLKREQERYALDALKQPGEKDPAFTFGHRCGYVAGLDRAVEVLLELQAREQEEEKFL